MEPIKLRGHHAEKLLGYYSEKKMGIISIPEEIYAFYGIEYLEALLKTYDKILEGKTPVFLVDEHDDLCSRCNCRREEGCLLDDGFFPNIHISKADRVVANRFGLEIGATYEGKYFLEKLKLI